MMSSLIHRQITLTIDLMVALKLTDWVEPIPLQISKVLRAQTTDTISGTEGDNSLDGAIGGDTIDGRGGFDL